MASGASPSLYMLHALWFLAWLTKALLAAKHFINDPNKLVSQSLKSNLLLNPTISVDEVNKGSFLKSYNPSKVQNLILALQWYIAILMVIHVNGESLSFQEEALGMNQALLALWGQACWMQLCLVQSSHLHLHHKSTPLSAVLIHVQRGGKDPVLGVIPRS